MSLRAIQVVDLGFGDSGKGTIIDYLARQHRAALVVRFNGGPQAAHNVVLPDGRHHTFAQFGSGTLAGVPTLLAREVLFDPYAILNEADHLRELGIARPLQMLSIDRRCRVISPLQQVANRVTERVRGPGQHGTCGMGVGECVALSLARPELTLTASDLDQRACVQRKLMAQREHYRVALHPLRRVMTREEIQVIDDPAWMDVAGDVYREVASRVTDLDSHEIRQRAGANGCVLFEGAQGVLIDERHGFSPHTTWSNTTFDHSDVLLDDVERQVPVSRTRVGVVRTYTTRHGAGPLPTYDADWSERLVERHNRSDGIQGAFRCGPLDLPLLKYALRVSGGADELAVTHLDQLETIGGRVAVELDAASDVWSAGRRMQRFSIDPDAFCDRLAEAFQVSVTCRSSGPTWNDKRLATSV